MIKIGNEFELEHSGNDWQLHTLTHKPDEKNGGMKTTRKTSYFPNLKLCCNAMGNKVAAGCNSVEEIVSALDSFGKVLNDIFGEHVDAQQEKRKRVERSLRTNQRADAETSKVADVKSNQMEPPKNDKVDSSQNDDVDPYQSGLALAIESEAANV